MRGQRTHVTALAAALVALTLLTGCTRAGRPVSADTTDATDATAVRLIHRTPSAADPLRVLLVGDGVMYDLVPALQAALTAAGPVAVTAAPVLGFGLTRPEFYDWRAQWPALVDRVRPEVTIALVGPWDVRTLEVDGRHLGPGGPGWASWYRRLADDALGILTARQGTVVWVGMTWEAAPGINPKVAALNAVLRALPARHREVSFVDGAAALAGPRGGYARVQTGADGRPVSIMKGDGEHLCPAGAARLARATVAGVARTAPLTPSSGWESGGWRDDTRYHWSFGGGCAAA